MFVTEQISTINFRYFIAISSKGGIPLKLFSWLRKSPFCERTRMNLSHLSSIHTVKMLLFLLASSFYLLIAGVEGDWCI